MITPQELQNLVGADLFPGAENVFGLIVFAALMYLILSLTQDTLIMSILAIPIMIILTVMGLLSVTITFLMIIVIVVIIAFSTGSAVFGGDDN